LPHARLQGDGAFDIIYEVPNYRAFPMVHQLALSNWLEAKVGLFENRVLHRSHEVSESILLAFQRRCDQEGVALVVAGILDDPVTRDMLERCRRAGIDTVDISVDLTVEGFRNLPHDAHPSALAHQAYADKLLTHLTESGALN